MENCYYIYAMYFTAGGDAGLALVSARTDMEALQILKNGGRFNATPSTYVVNKYRNIGLSSCIRNEILMEAYTNAEGIFNRLMQVVDCLKGDKGDPGDTTIIGATQSDWNQTDDSQLDYIKNKPTIPSTLAQLSSDTLHRTVTDSQISSWDSKLDEFSIDNFTEGSTIANADYLCYYDKASGKNKKITWANFLTALSAVISIDSLTDEEIDDIWDEAEEEDID